MRSSDTRVSRRGALRRGGYTLAEVLVVVIIIGIIAAFVVPQFSNAGTNAREQSVHNQLRVLRAAVELYKAQHKEADPNLSAGWTVLMQPSDEDGGTTGSPLYGPYIPKAPVNPLTGGSSVGNTLAPGIDWFWDSSAGTITAMDGHGNAVSESP